jgi:hypothetical protein
MRERVDGECVVRERLLVRLEGGFMMRR